MSRVMTALAAGALTLAFGVLAAPAASADTPDPGNSTIEHHAPVVQLPLHLVQTGVAAATGRLAAAQACLHSYANLTRADGTGFTNVGQCISYAAMGGTLVTRPSLEMTFNQGTITVTGAGLQPGAPVYLCNTAPGGCTAAGRTFLGSVGPDGSFSVSKIIGCNPTPAPLMYVESTTAAGQTIDSSIVELRC